MTEEKKKKLNSKWRKGNDRAPTPEERQYLQRAIEPPGFWHGAKVYKKP